ncbi:MAG: monovalent cation/H(+) antiporter subunit G [Spirochaetota bacterium]|nr:monovalent cation/H(+) antiporter subunit G [Spirochaetota bacterium]
MVIASKILIVSGLFFLTTGVIGFLRFPDFYSRMHATGKGDTLGALLILLGFALYNLHHGFVWLDIVQSVKLILIAVFWIIASPTATHALLRSTFESGVQPWTKDGKTVIDWPLKEEK